MFNANPHDPSKIENFPYKECMKAGKMLLQGAVNLGEDNASGVQSCVVESMHADEISRTVKSDPLLLLFGQTQFSKLGAKRASLVREKLRLAGRLKLSIRKLTGMENAHIDDFLIPELFDACVNGVKEIAEITTQNSQSGTKVFARPFFCSQNGAVAKETRKFEKGPGNQESEFHIQRKNS